MTLGLDARLDLELEARVVRRIVAAAADLQDHTGVALVAEREDRADLACRVAHVGAAGSVARLASDAREVRVTRDVGAGRLAVLWHIVLPRIGNSILVAISFSVLGIFSAFTLPYVLGPAAPEMMGPFMQRTFRDLYDPTNAITQAVISFCFCIIFGLFYVRSVVKNQRGR